MAPLGSSWFNFGFARHPAKKLHSSLERWPLCSCPNDALYAVSPPSSPGPGNDVTVYNADAGLCHTRLIWLVGAWHVARAGLPYLSYRMFRDEVEAAGERN